MFGHNDQNGQNDNNDGYGQSPIIGGLGTPPGIPSQDSPAPPPPPPADEPLLTAEASEPQTTPTDSSPVSDDGGVLGAPMPPSIGSSADPTSDLIDLKSKALHQLAPLVDKLDQSPEEKFRTTMMMIQASDNQALINDAYEAAQAIPDEKAKAQALLDVVNEINYFTQR
ncbi:MAG TPA: hypothetical protein VIH90_02020 [Candidatus Saccharimonadales bacterium]